MSKIKFFLGESMPLEMHKVRVVQKLNLIPIEKRKQALDDGGYNTFLLKNREVFLDMLTDSGTNAMSDRQVASMMVSDDSYAGSETFYRLEKELQSFFGMKFFLPAHQGRACENIIAKTFVKPGDIIPMNYHFTTTKAHIELNGGKVEEVFTDEAVKITSTNPFKGNFDLDKLKKFIKEVGVSHIPFARIEMGTNLIGGQPVSLENIKAVANICHKNNILVVTDASLLADNLHFIKEREEACKNMSLHDIVLEIAKVTDVMYFSARKLGCARGGGICVHDVKLFDMMKDLIPLYEGFLTYGGMSVREMEAMAIGLEETLDPEMINQGPLFIEAFGKKLMEQGIPIVTPTGGLGCHIDARAFLPHVKSEEYPAGALAAAIFLVGGIRGMERGTISETRNPDGSEHPASVELVRLALPRRVFTMSQISYAVDRIAWLFKNRDLVQGLDFVEEPKVLRFFIGRLAPINNWSEKLVKKFREDFGDSL
ncbi:MAG: tryptophanase [Bacilli bacterium]|nr:tryptophanase [Bacilli bacterium]